MNLKVVIPVILGLLLLGVSYFIASPKTSDLEEDRAWQVLEKYLNYAKEHDIEGLSSLSYQLSSSCKDLANQKDCFDRMDTVYILGQDIKREDIKNVWADEKQIILSSDYTYFETEEVVSRTRKIIYFIKEGETIKLLKFHPAQGAILPIASSTQEAKQEIKNKLVELTGDQDKDGLEDILEKNTKIEERDTDGDGLWDGIEAQFTQN